MITEKELQNSIPKINFKKIKLHTASELENRLKAKNITTISLTDKLDKINFPLKRVTKEESYENIQINPLRKKAEVEDFEVRTEEPQEEFKEEIQEVTKDITFNLEEEIAQEEENIILTPLATSLPPFKEDVVSASGEQNTFIWPPKEGKKSKPKKKTTLKKNLKQKKKRKPYFIQTTPPLPKESTSFPFGWLTAEQEYKALENIFQGGLELELTGEERITQPPKETPIQSEFKAKDTSHLTEKQPFKAIKPNLPDNLTNELLNNINPKEIKLKTSFDLLSKVNFGIDLLGKAEKMFNQYKSKLSPLKIIALGGLTATFGYLIWNYYHPAIDIDSFYKQKNTKEPAVRDLFKSKYTMKEKLNIEQNESKEKLAQKTSEESLFKPITEEERQAIIQKAREALESRIDPFLQDAVLPQSTIEERIKEKEEAEKPPPDIQLLRKQVELVGVISTKDKNLALVNVYTADYTVSPDDDKTARDTKLKAALGMAVPNRIELSVLDPVEDWYIKAINKSKSSSEDPTIELVKGDKKFKLKVGQRVLLPEEKNIPEQKSTEDNSDDT